MKPTTLHQLSPYLKDIKIASIDIKGNVTSIYDLEIENNNDKGILNVINGVNQFPILRKFDLNSEIIVQGKKTIPIVEISKVITGTHGEIKRNMSGDIIGVDSGTGYFIQHIKGFIFSVKRGQSQLAFNCNDVYQYLFENKFDVFNQIGVSAIDADTLNPNPYNT